MILCSASRVVSGKHGHSCVVFLFSWLSVASSVAIGKATLTVMRAVRARHVRQGRSMFLPSVYLTSFLFFGFRFGSAVQVGLFTVLHVIDILRDVAAGREY